jgi:hypothetical protein
MPSAFPTIELKFEPYDETIVVDPAVGEFLAISRFFINRERSSVEPLIYEIVKTLNAAEFYAILGEPVATRISLDALSDHLVRAFDAGELTDRNGFNCMFIWKNADGVEVHQHST